MIDVGLKKHYSGSYIVFDVETSKIPKHYPWEEGAYLSTISMAKRSLNKDNIETKSWVFFHDEVITVDSYKNIKEIQAEINSADIIVNHNLKFDLLWFRKLGINFWGKQYFCTMIGENIIRGQDKILRYSLDESLKRYRLPLKQDIVHQYWDNGIDTAQIPLNTLVEYAEKDCSLTLRLFEEQLKVIKRNNQESLQQIQSTFSVLLGDIEYKGIPTNTKVAQEIVDSSIKIRDEIEEQIKTLAGIDFNPRSSAQLSAALYGGEIKGITVEERTVTLKSGLEKKKKVKTEIKIPVKGLGFKPIPKTETKKQGIYKTDTQTIKQLTSETEDQRLFIDLLLKRSHEQKVIQSIQKSKKGDKASILDAYKSDGRIHPKMNFCLTPTGRITSSNPNGQNFPRKGTSPIKTIFYATKDFILNIDEKQLEWRVAAALSKDEIALYEIRHGIDAHAENAIAFLDADPNDRTSSVFKMLRNVAKTITFGLLYGRSPVGFMKDPRMPKYPRKKWVKVISDFYKKYKGLYTWQQENIKEVLKTGRLITPSKRILKFKKVYNFDGVLAPKEQAIFNFPVQSFSFDITALVIVLLLLRLRQLGIPADFILFVHDSLVFDVYLEDVQRIIDAANEVLKDFEEYCLYYFDWEIPVPVEIDAEIGLTYGALIEYNNLIDLVQMKKSVCSD